MSLRISSDLASMPKAFMATLSSLVSIEPEPSVSKRSNASLISATWSSVSPCLAIEKKNNHKLSAKERKHLVMLEACDDEYQYHYKLFGEGAGADRDMKFYAPQMVQDYINQIRRF